MSEGEPAVRVELLGSGQTDSNIVMPSGPRRAGGPSWLPAAAMALGVLGVLGGLWWLSSVGSTEEAGRDQVPAVVEESPATTSPPEADADLAASAGGPTFIRLSVDPTHVTIGAEGPLFAERSRTDERVDDERPQLLQTADGYQWELRPTDGLGPDAQIVGLHLEGPKTLLFVTTPQSAANGGVELVVYENDPLGQPTVLDDEWTERSRFVIDGFIRTVSARDGQWVAVVDRRAQAVATDTLPMQTQFVTGRFDGQEGVLDVTEVAPDEFVSSFAAIDGGFYAVVVRLQLNTLGDQPLTPQLRRWSVDGGWSIESSDLWVPPGGAPVRLIDAGQNGVFASFQTQLFAVDPTRAPDDWISVASGHAVAGSLDETFSPETSPALAGNGFLITDTVVGDVETVWISTNGALWQRFSFAEPIRDLSLIQITESGDALVLGESAGDSVFVLLPLTRPAPGTSNSSVADGTPAFEPEVIQRTIVDGEWSTPVFSTATIDGAGFVGLTNQNGSIALTRSSDGADVETSSRTNFPFGYFTNDMVTTGAGYHVVGQLGLFEDAVFLSTDGETWDRFPIELPGDASALQIDHFHRSEGSSVVVGSLGWTDDLERTELVALWWDGNGERVRFDARPCGDEIIRCSITSVVAVTNGVVATHQRGNELAVSRWTEESGWVAPIPGRLFAEPVVAESVSTDLIRILGLDAIIESDDAGVSWYSAQDAPPGVSGRFVAVSGDGETVAFVNDTDAWLLSQGLWTRFTLARLELGTPLAIADGVALFSGTNLTGVAIIRLAAAQNS